MSHSGAISRIVSNTVVIDGKNVSSLENVIIPVLQHLCGRNFCPRCILRYLNVQNIPLYREKEPSIVNILNQIREEAIKASQTPLELPSIQGIE
jgi:hypothetical protein